MTNTNPIPPIQPTVVPPPTLPVAVPAITPKTTIVKGGDLFIFKRGKLVDSSISVPRAPTKWNRTTIKVKSEFNRSGWRQITVPSDFIYAPPQTSINTQKMTVGQLKKALENYDDELPICVSNGINKFAPAISHLSLEEALPADKGYLEKTDDNLDSNFQPVVIIYT